MSKEVTKSGEEKVSLKVKTPPATLSYPFLAEPRSQDGQKEPKYSASLLFAPGTDLSELKAAVVAAATERWGQSAVAKLKSGALKSPFRTDWEAKGYPEGTTFVNASSKNKPGAVYAWADPETDKPAKIPADKIAEELYPGAKVRASLRAFAYDTDGNKGVSFGLNNVQKLGDGPRLDGYTAAEDDFEADPNAAAPAPADLPF